MTNCLNQDQLDCFVADELSAEEREQCTMHVADCESCATSVAQLQREEDQFRQLFSGTPELDSQTLHMINDRAARRVSGVRLSLWKRAAALLVAVGLFAALMSPPKSDPVAVTPDPDDNKVVVYVPYVDPDPDGDVEPAPTEFVSIQSSAADSTLVKKIEEFYGSHETGRLYVQLDKPLYRPGETIWFKASLFDTANLAPINELNLLYCELLDPRGSVVLKKNIKASNGSGENDFIIPSSIPGGEFTLKVSCKGGFNKEKKFTVNNYQPPLIKKKMKVLGKAYGPGDTIHAEASLFKGTGEALVEHDVSAWITVEGVKGKVLKLKTNQEGALNLNFDLPEDINEDDAFLTLKVTQGGLTESISRNIPIFLSKLNVEFFPEGGDLVQGLPSRVYFSATRTNGKAAEVAGVILDDTGKEITKVSSFHHGMGRFDFIPEPSRAYRLKVTRPAGVHAEVELPKVMSSGIVMKVDDDLKGKSTEIGMHLFSSRSLKDVTVLAVVRDNLEAAVKVDLKAGDNYLTINPSLTQGVMRLSVLDSAFRPLSERLVYRGQGRDLKVEITTDRDHYGPREPVKLEIRTSLPNGKPVPAELALSVVDDRVLAYADDKAAHLLTALYLERDLPGEIEDPNFYFDPTEARAPLALELLMGTRGWRKFVWTTLLNDQQDIRLDDQIFRKVLAQHVPRPDADFLLFGDGGVGVPEAEDFMERPEMMAEVRRNIVPKVGPVVELADVMEPQDDPAPAMDMAMKPMPVLREAEVMEAKIQAGGWFGVVRKFPQVFYKTNKTEVRNDFRETLFWNPRVTTNEDGVASLTFYTSDAITSFLIRAEGSGLQGTPGRVEKQIDSRAPLHVEAKMPVVLTSGDLLHLPLRFTNETQRTLDVTGATDLPDFLTNVGSNKFDSFTLSGQQARTHFLSLQAKPGTHRGRISFKAGAEGLFENVQREIRVEARGFPISESLSGTVGGTETLNLTLPEMIVDGTLSGTIKLYPSPLADMAEGMESMLREPCGCFEQTSSSNYPNVMILTYLNKTGTMAPAIETRALSLLKKGYTKLTSFECTDKGYEWFGQGMGHEALTAYGVMEFVDMAAVSEGIDQKMIDRTASWLMKRRDGNGGFKRNSRALDSFGRAPADVTNAYIVWALSEANIEGFDREIESAVKLAESSKNPYTTSLAAMACLKSDSYKKQAEHLLSGLKSMRETDGHFSGKDRSITGSQGRTLDIETTSLAILAQLRSGGNAASVLPSVRWLLAQRSGGSFGATQSTILALKALTEYTEASRTVQKDGTLIVKVNGTEVERKSFFKGDQGVINIEGLQDHLLVGKNELTLEILGGAELPYSLDLSYKATKPASDEECPIRIKTVLQQQSLDMVEVATLKVNVMNKTDEGQAMTLARVGIPAGLTAQTWQLKELQESGKIDFYEVTSREVVLYFRSMAPNADREVSLELRADLPGEFTAQASSAYLYYGMDQKWWTDPVKVTVSHK